MHDLDPSQSSVLPDIGFQLPHLQGSNISEHFHRIGVQTAEPWLSLAKSFASQELPPKPDHWHIQSGWTKYYYLEDGSSYGEHVNAPIHDGKPEQMLTFDVETMPKHHPYPIMACAASPNAWYAWISPWLLGETDDPEQLIPLGDPTVPRLVVGHNVSYDRIRLLEEYSISGTRNRFIDTMSLHVAVHGISSHQRPAWTKYRKLKLQEEEQQREAIQIWMEKVRQRQEEGLDPERDDEATGLLKHMEETLMQLQPSSPAPLDIDIDESSEENAAKRWEDVTSANSLADVAKLHCGINISKEARDDLMTLQPEDIRENITDYLDYCATDVAVTQEVYKAVLHAFLLGCPHPATFAGVLTMGSSFLTVDDSWEEYIERADAVYRSMEENVQKKLKHLAEEAKKLMDGDEKVWKNDPWLSQLDWTPKVAGKSRGILPPTESTLTPTDETSSPQTTASDNKWPVWYLRVVADPLNSLKTDSIIPLLLRISYNGKPLLFNTVEGWHYKDGTDIVHVKLRKGTKTKAILTKAAIKEFDAGNLRSSDNALAISLCANDADDKTLPDRIAALAEAVLRSSQDERSDAWLSQLNWDLVSKEVSPDGKMVTPSKVTKVKKVKPPKPPSVLWPAWYWEATKPKKGMPPGTLEVTVRNRIAPILLRLSWSGYPLVHSREHGWTFRVPADAGFKTRLSPVSFYDPEDSALAEAALSGGYLFYKLPHKDGDKANVGNPLGKSFMNHVKNGTLKSPGDEAQEALDLSVHCSYWISARDRVRSQLVIWQNPERNLGLPEPTEGRKKQGVILPQVITMGAVTRRAIEKTWLTASNAKKDRVGSELKAMVKAPKGYAIVGADVDSEELWISSCMGDAQFGLHGASAIGWMTLEGTKAAGTDLHSKTASILGISRNQAKVFNYSRIYGAGMKHAVLLLLQSNPSMLPEQAQKLAENLYASTKGKNTHRSDIFDRKFWFGGTESYLFNKLEEIAVSEKPQTPALGCGVTYGLTKEYLPAGFGSDYMPSRINWVVQSSGVDYLHLLIVSMNHLLAKYDIKARYLISVHDELRYLVVEEDKYRVALALQIANLWTRSMFAYKLGMDDLPQGVAFFSAVDVDHVLRKEVDMPCITPSQPTPIPPGESLDIAQVLEKTNGGSLMKDASPMPKDQDAELVGSLEGYLEPNCLLHRASSVEFLEAQATDDFEVVKELAQQATGKKYPGAAQPQRRKKAPMGTGEGFDWASHAERFLAENPHPPNSHSIL
ncbi:gamma DNA-directed DNA polymerase [Agrocybe pediades]|nr:gamma DNA-directed DNA polymerase [Agrocybe pediades]